MIEDISRSTCDAGCCQPEDAKQEAKESNECPVCGHPGKPVKDITVKSLIKDELSDGVKGQYLHLCLDKDCKVAYYDNVTEEVITAEDLKVPIWYKSDVPVRYACYCAKITKEEVIDAVVNKGLTGREEISQALRGEFECECVKNNPQGSCCSKAFKEMINQALDGQEER